jgi:hypothetical protein
MHPAIEPLKAEVDLAVMLSLLACFYLSECALPPHEPSVLASSSVRLVPSQLLDDGLLPPPPLVLSTPLPYSLLLLLHRWCISTASSAPTLPLSYILPCFCIVAALAPPHRRRRRPRLGSAAALAQGKGVVMRSGWPRRKLFWAPAVGGGEAESG